MTNLQEKLLEMLSAFHELCKNHGLRYYLLGGSALGAARHQGFIPWDDDVDVGMPRGDYEELRKIVADKLLGNYSFEFPNPSNKSFVYMFGKMYDTTTTLVENTRYKTKRGVYIDIFPLDGGGETYEESLRLFKVIDKKNNLLHTKICAWRKGRSLYKNLACVCMRCVPEFIVSTKKLKREIEDLSKQRSFDDSPYVVNYYGAWHEKEIVKKAWLGEPVEGNFEGLKVMCPADSDAYLTALYGDWRTPPPKEKQISHHDYISLDLHKSYLEK